MQNYKGTTNGTLINELALTFWKRRDDASFSKLHDALKPGIRASMYKFKNMDEFERELVVDQVMVKVWEKIDMFDPEKAKFTTWIYSIAHIEALRYIAYRKVGARRTLELTGYEEQADCGTEYHEPYEGLTYEIAEDAIRALPDGKYRDALILHDLEGVKYKNIAEKLNLEIGTVKTHISRGRAMVRKLLVVESAL